MSYGINVRDIMRRKKVQKQSNTYAQNSGVFVQLIPILDTFLTDELYISFSIVIETGSGLLIIM